MKNITNRIVRKSSVSKFLFAVLLTTAAFSSNAQSGSKAVLGDPNISIRFTGMQEDMMSMLLQFGNAQKEKYSIKVYDDHKNQLHSEIYEGVSYSKAFKVAVEEGPLTFTVENLKTKVKTTFMTTNIVRSYTDVAIVKIK